VFSGDTTSYNDQTFSFGDNDDPHDPRAAPFGNNWFPGFVP
jgi:hypothetical protein